MSVSTLYPLKFQTLFKQKIWGGQKLLTHLGKDFGPLPNCGETWEISGLAPDVSVVVNGEHGGQTLPALLARYREALVGGAVYRRFGNAFPLLVKFIDASDDLSIQTHPNDDLARARHNASGKTEMWYVVHADDGATLVTGFNQQASPELYLEKLRGGRLEEILNREHAAAGDVFFLPAGRVHTLGKGLLVAEIQQASDITYRIYDFDRKDGNGGKRALHTGQALGALDYAVYPEYKSVHTRELNAPVKVVECDYFTTNILECSRPVTRDYSVDSFVIHVCVQGSYTLVAGPHRLDVTMGECVLVPAAFEQVRLTTEGGFTVLESYISSL